MSSELTLTNDCLDYAEILKKYMCKVGKQNTDPSAAPHLLLTVSVETVREPRTSFLNIHIAVTDICHTHLGRSQSLLMKEFVNVIFFDEAHSTATDRVTLQGLKPLLQTHGSRNLVACINFFMCIHLRSISDAFTFFI